MKNWTNRFMKIGQMPGVESSSDHQVHLFHEHSSVQVHSTKLELSSVHKAQHSTPLFSLILLR